MSWLGIQADWSLDYRLFYYLTLGLLVAVIVLLQNLERSRLGRAWVAIREDELAATCMGINAARVKLSAFALGCGLAGMAGCLYATTLTSTAGPDAFDFNRSIIMLCCVILGGLGSLRGTLLGVVLLIGFDNVVAPIVDGLIQAASDRHVGKPAVDVQQLEADDLRPGADADDAVPARGAASLARRSRPRCHAARDDPPRGPPIMTC